MVRAQEADLIGQWTKQDAELLVGTHVIFEGTAWRGAFAFEAGTEWRLAIKDPSGRLDNIGRADVERSLAHIGAKIYRPTDVRLSNPEMIKEIFDYSAHQRRRELSCSTSSHRT